MSVDSTRFFNCTDKTFLNAKTDNVISDFAFFSHLILHYYGYLVLHFLRSQGGSKEMIDVCSYICSLTIGKSQLWVRKSCNQATFSCFYNISIFSKPSTMVIVPFFIALSFQLSYLHFSFSLPGIALSVLDIFFLKSMKIKNAVELLIASALWVQSWPCALRRENVQSFPNIFCFLPSS